MSEELTFSSKTDLWLLIVLLAAVTTCIWVVAESWDLILTRGWLVAGLILVPLAAGIVMPLWLVISLRYFMSDEMLRVRCGPFQWRIGVGDIAAVTPTTSSISSPAMSLDRLKIEYGDGRAVLISPEPRAEFLRQLEFRRRQATA